ncbi:hypothetical protein C8R44DRAFT_982298 [Mycena epipterygia]|nr:hypothetical protein C8R44DRAFT_982298 [Mycena epipterygia]
MSGASRLDPGPPPRKRSSLCKFCLCLGVVLACLFLAIIIFGIGKALLQFTQFSHSRVFQNQTLEEVKNRAAVVRPLIDGSQTFDIAVSIWTLPTEENDGERIGDVVETPLYSDIVFRELRLSDKNKAEVLTYKLPVAVYRRLLLKENDLRASFVAIPTSPSLVDHITNFTTWRPENMTIPPVRSWPFPLETSSENPKDMADRALDSFGISIPLLEFHEIHSKCANNSDSEIPELSSQQVEDEANDTEEEEERDEDEAVDNGDEIKDPLLTFRKDFIDVNWQLSYSGRTPAKFIVAERMSAQRIGHLESDYKKANAHDAAELTNGLFGHRFYNDAHPRRRLGIGLLTSILSFVLIVLDMGYWYTRTSTVSISLSGTVLIALSAMITGLSQIANSAETQKLNNLTSQWLQWLWLIIVNLIINFSLPWFMLKAVTRLEFSRNNSNWFPSVRRIGPTHKERNSQRLDSRTTWGVKAGVCISLIAIYYLFSPDEYHVISAHRPALGPSDKLTNSVAHVSALVFYPLKFTGQLSQLLLNQRTKKFAGSYKIAVILRSIMVALQVLQYLPSVVGRFDARPGFSAPSVVSVIMLAVTLWQVITLPTAMQTTEDEDSE